jgi:hypothetical protein
MQGKVGAPSFAKIVGCIGLAASASTKICEVYLTELVKHLGPFMSYMNHHFAPVERQLARMREYGQIDFALLPYYFEPGQKFMYYDDHSGRPDAFILESRYVERLAYNLFVALERDI